MCGHGTTKRTGADSVPPNSYINNAYETIGFAIYLKTID